VVGEREGETFLESQVFMETPFNRRLAFIMRPWLEIAQTAGDELSYRDETTAGLKAVAFRNDQYAVAVQAAALWRSTEDPACSESGSEWRVLAGSSDGASDAFFNAEAAFQSLGDCERRKFDVTFGYRPNERWLGLVEGFADAAQDGSGAIRTQISLVRFLENGTGIQFGVRVRLDDEEAEPGLVVALWRELLRRD
jgi:hypothetical protein